MIIARGGYPATGFDAGENRSATVPDVRGNWKRGGAAGAIATSVAKDHLIPSGLTAGCDDPGVTFGLPDAGCLTLAGKAKAL